MEVSCQVHDQPVLKFIYFFSFEDAFGSRVLDALQMFNVSLSIMLVPHAGPCDRVMLSLSVHVLLSHPFSFLQLNFLITENRQREIVDSNCEGVQGESLDALLSVATQCVSSGPEDRPTMHRVVQLLESEVMTPCPSDFYDSNSD